MTAPNSALDDRLRAIYGRLHVQAIKVAILLAALDWADDETASHASSGAADPLVSRPADRRDLARFGAPAAGRPG